MVKETVTGQTACPVVVSAGQEVSGGGKKGKVWSHEQTRERKVYIHWQLLPTIPVGQVHEKTWLVPPLQLPPFRHVEKITEQLLQSPAT